MQRLPGLLAGRSQTFAALARNVPSGVTKPGPKRPDASRQAGQRQVKRLTTSANQKLTQEEQDLQEMAKKIAVDMAMTHYKPARLKGWTILQLLQEYEGILIQGPQASEPDLKRGATYLRALKDIGLLPAGGTPGQRLEIITPLRLVECVPPLKPYAGLLKKGDFVC